MCLVKFNRKDNCDRHMKAHHVKRKFDNTDDQPEDVRLQENSPYTPQHTLNRRTVVEKGSPSDLAKLGKSKCVLCTYECYHTLVSWL